MIKIIDGVNVNIDERLIQDAKSIGFDAVKEITEAIVKFNKTSGKKSS